MEQFESGATGVKHALKALIYEEMGNLRSAIDEAQICTRLFRQAYPVDPINMSDLYISLLAKDNHVSEAENMANTLKKDIENSALNAICAYWQLMASIENVKGNKQKEIACLEEMIWKPHPHFLMSISMVSDFWALPTFRARYCLAQASLEEGRQDIAITELEKALSDYGEGQVSMPILAVKAHYLLAQAYEKSGWTQKAIEEYETFLAFWKDADPGIPEVQDAKIRLASLK